MISINELIESIQWPINELIEFTRIVIITFENKTPFWKFSLYTWSYKLKIGLTFSIYTIKSLSLNSSSSLSRPQRTSRTIFKSSSFEINDVSFYTLKTHHLGNDSWSKTYPGWINVYNFMKLLRLVSSAMNPKYGFLTFSKHYSYFC